MVEVVFRKNLHINYISGLRNGRTHRRKRRKKVVPQVCSSVKGGFQICLWQVLNFAKKFRFLELKSGCLFYKLTYFLKIEPL